MRIGTVTDTPEKEEHQAFHFFGSNFAEWRVEEDLEKLMKDMKRSCKLNHAKCYHVFYVPLPGKATYDIRGYCPDVQGCVYLGTYSK